MSTVALEAVLLRADQEIGRAREEVQQQVTGAEGRLARAENRHAEATARCQRRTQELEQQPTLTLRGVERLTGVLAPIVGGGSVVCGGGVRAWVWGRRGGAGSGSVVLDIDSTLVEVHSENKAGAARSNQAGSDADLPRLSAA